MKALNFDLSPTPPRISQHFISLEGEGKNIGHPSFYLRLAGCFSAACSFCDTKFSWTNSRKFPIIGDEELTTELKEKFKDVKIKRFTVTGGEPLHYMKWFHKIVEWLLFVNPGFKFFGIESNGNLLSRRDNTINLIAAFNEIDKDFGIKPVLTISPKLDAAACYENQLDQKTVDEMYREALININRYLRNFEVHYKFIYDFTGEYVDFAKEKKLIDFLTNELKVGREFIMLMPFTPQDPLQKDSEFWIKSKDLTSRKALEIGVKYSPRLHIDRKLD